MRNTHRRVVTGNVNGKSVVQSDERLPPYAFETVNGYEHTLFWVNRLRRISTQNRSLIAIRTRLSRVQAVRVFTW
jgi:hypothetical protein